MNHPLGSYSAFVASRVKWLDSPSADFMHAAVGIAGEVGELASAYSRENILEEAGDLCFYLEHFRLAGERHLQGEFGNWESLAEFHLPLNEVLGRMSTEAASVLDYAKKLWVYNKPFDYAFAVGLHSALSGVQAGLFQLLTIVDVPLHEAQRANMEKLLKRYPTGYSDAAAQARADKQEGAA